MIEKDTTVFKCKAMGSYALTPISNNYLEFVENQKKSYTYKIFGTFAKMKILKELLCC